MIFMTMTDLDKELLIKIRKVLNNIDVRTDDIHVSDIREVIAHLNKLEASLTRESSLVLMGSIAQSSAGK
jgi:hypothetical protein